MKIEDIIIENYKPILNGLGLTKLHIDFRKGTHKITVIKGLNGSGKTEILSAISILPDKNNKFIDGVDAIKKLLVSNDDVWYKIVIKHPVNKKGERDTTKAFITKILGTEEIELNPNGNVKSYNDIIYSEFSLDPNFMALTQLSLEDKGIVERTPSERKKFVTPIIGNIQVYNDIYKTLSKRSSVFKSMMNTLISKIETLGTEESLKLNLKSLEDRLNKLMDNKDGLIEELASYKSKIKILDPDGSIQTAYNNIYNSIVNINKDLETNKMKINNKLKKMKLNIDISTDELLNKQNELKNNIIEYDSIIKINQSKMDTILNEKHQQGQQLQNKIAKMQSLKCDKNFEDLVKMIDDTKATLSEYKIIIDKMNIKDPFSISKEEFIIGLNTLNEIKESIDIVRSYVTYNTLEKSVQYIQNNTKPDINKLNDEILNLTNRLNTYNLQLQHYSTLLEVSKKLELRPSKCTIDSCGFIKDALNASKEKPSEMINKITKDIEITNNRLEECNKLHEEYKDTLDCINLINNMIRNFQKHSSILNKLPINNILKDKDELLFNMLNGNTFEEVDTLYSYLEYANVIEDYKCETNKLNSLLSDYKVYESKTQIINDLISDIDDLNAKIDSMSTELKELSDETTKYQSILSDSKSLSLDFDFIISLFNDKQCLENNKNELISKFNYIKSNMIEIKECLNKMDQTKNKLDNINKEIDPLIKDRDQFNYSIKLIIQYKMELQDYKMKYEKVELIKKYTSPTKEGIQIQFMKLYLGTTVSLANELLTYLFEGKYYLDNFIINEDEFRIPCKGNSIINDDISSMSSAQKCMISMILSFVLLYQSSSKYNILRLDEIDGPLDNTNRSIFMNVLNMLIDLLKVDQCILVSHNMEADLSNCDIIQLKSDGVSKNYEGNVIYDYNM